ncbi:hypothetical protein [Myroides odoratimimus]|uniref:hypothetical protein n=1 Tax=Myroides odoratimimus TaxID=76832 RepID=UPI0025753485|nr:hypothetical protein [Myroides odoratimimus]MDM1093398.1 hypothetical protein [Myroides odoratimimus]
MQDSLNALQCYLDTLRDKAVFYTLTITNSMFVRIVLFSNSRMKEKDIILFIDIAYTEEGVSKILEQVENYVESIIKKNEPIKN